MPEDRPDRHEALSGARAQERRLRRMAVERSLEATDPELVRLLGRVAARRSHRYRRMMRQDALGEAEGPSHREPGEPRAPDGHATPGEPRAPSGQAASGGEILAVRDVASTVRILQVARPTGFAFRAGQNVKLGVAGADARKPYSIASAPHEPHLEFCLELVPDGRLTPRLFGLGPGDRIELGPSARGRFALDPEADTHLMVATVTGIAPLRSMLLDAVHQGTAGTFVLVHGASHAGELPYRQELESLAAERPDRLRYVPTISRPGEAGNEGWGGETGRADVVAERWVEALGAGGRIRAYACGNPGMVENVVTSMEARGLPVSTEKFD